MTPDFILHGVAAFACALLVVATLLRKWRSLASWSFAAGMATFGIKTAFAGFGLIAVSPAEAIYWQRLVLIAGSFLPAFWLCFSLTYARGNAREFLIKWKFLLLAFFVVPVGIALAFHSSFSFSERASRGKRGLR